MADEQRVQIVEVDGIYKIELDGEELDSPLFEVQKFSNLFGQQAFYKVTVNLDTFLDMLGGTKIEDPPSLY